MLDNCLESYCVLGASTAGGLWRSPLALSRFAARTPIFMIQLYATFPRELQMAEFLYVCILR
ncbi:MAG TPA: hypothetical protein V6D03_12740 [Candidatus Caenarcaniphilales bacterium]